MQPAPTRTRDQAAGPRGGGGAPRRFASSNPVSASMQTLQRNQWEVAKGEVVKRQCGAQKCNSRPVKHMRRGPVGSQEIQRKRCRTTRKSATKSVRNHSEKCGAGTLRIQRSRLRPRDFHFSTPNGRPKSADLRPPRSRRSPTANSPDPDPRRRTQQASSPKVGLRVLRRRPRYVAPQILRRRPRRRIRS